MAANLAGVGGFFASHYTSRTKHQEDLSCPAIKPREKNLQQKICRAKHLILQMYSCVCVAHRAANRGQ
jgi:hypothetical protein